MKKRQFSKRRIISISTGVLMWTLAIFVIASPRHASADETSSSGATSGTIQCDATDKYHKGLAEQANTALVNMKKHFDDYTASFAKVKNLKYCISPSAMSSDAHDSSLASQISSGTSTTLDAGYSSYEELPNNDLKWGDHDAQGASLGNQHVSTLQTNFNAVSGELTNTNLDLNYYLNEVSATQKNVKVSLRDATEKLEKATTSADKQSAQNAIKLYNGELTILENCTKLLMDTYNKRQALKADRDTAHSRLASLSGEVTSSCSCNAETGEILNCQVVDDNETQKDISPAECKELNEYVAELEICPVCGIFETILIADQSLAEGAFKALASDLSKLVLIAYLIFIAYQVLMLIGSPASQTVSKFLNTLLMQSFKVAVTVSLLSSPSVIYELAITPVIEGGFEFGLELTSADSKNEIDRFSSKYTSFSGDNALIPAKFLQNLMGAVEGFNAKAATIPALGRALICYSWVKKIWDILPHTGMLIEGVIVYIFGLMIILAVGFYMLDCAIHLGLLCCLMPFLVACWPFSLTAGYTSKGWNMVLNIFFRFVMVGVVVGTALQLISQALASGISPEDFATLLNADKIKELEDAMSISGMQMLILVVCCMIAMKLIKDVSGLAEQFAPGAQTGDLGANLGGAAASVATKVATGAAKKVGGSVSSATGALAEASGVKGAAQAVGGAVKGGIRNIAGRAGIGGKARMGAKGRDQSGGGKKDGGDDKKDGGDDKKEGGENKKDENKESGSEGKDK